MKTLGSCFAVLVGIGLLINGCDLPDIKTGVNGMKMVHDDFKGTSDYFSGIGKVDLKGSFLIARNAYLHAHHVVHDSDQTASDFLIANLTTEGWCFISDKDELIFLAGSDKLVLPASGDSSRTVITGDLVGEVAAYDLTKKDERFFELHKAEAVRVQIGSEQCNLEGTVDVAPLGDFFVGFQGVSGSAKAGGK